jgi:hypothetical protein
VVARPHGSPLKLPIEDEPKPVASPASEAPPSVPKRTVLVRGCAPASRQGGILVVTAKLHKGNASFSVNNLGKYFAGKATLAGRAIPCQPVVHRKTYPASWQAWRIAVPASDRDRDWTLVVTAMLPRDVKMNWNCYFIPGDQP